jgi:hypothetical protein
MKNIKKTRNSKSAATKAPHQLREEGQAYSEFNAQIGDEEAGGG